MSNGKGDTRRPTDVPEDEVTRRWAQTFGSARKSGSRLSCVRAPDVVDYDTLPTPRHVEADMAYKKGTGKGGKRGC
jgi:hypothetical protein